LFSPFFFSSIQNPNLLDYLIRSYQDIRGNRHADLLGRFQIDDKLKLHRLFYREIRVRLGVIA
jgi:hypothetical protein